MTDTARILIENFGYEENTARAYVRSLGKCEYCDDDLLVSWQSYSTSEIDHLLPKNLHQEHQFTSANYVTSCRTCNNLKGQFNPLIEGEDPQSMLMNSRDTLIKRVRDHLREKYEKLISEFQNVRDLIRPGDQE